MSQPIPQQCGPLAGADPTEPLVRTWREAKYCAPALGGMCLAVGLALVPGLLISPGITPIAVLLATLLVAPALAGSLEVADLIYGGAEPGIRALPAAIAHQAGGAVRTAAPMGLAGVSFLVSYAAYSATGQGLMLVPLAVAGGASVLLALASPFAFTLRQLTRLRGKRLWLSSAALAIARPSLSLGIAALVVLFVFAGLKWSVSVLILLPGPLALLSIVATRTACASKGIELPERPAATSPDATTPAVTD